MSRVANMGVTIPEGVDVTIKGRDIAVKGKGGQLDAQLHPDVKVTVKDGHMSFAPANASRLARSMSGTQRQLVANMVQGVTSGFEKKLTLIGVGYRAQSQGQKLNLSVGYSHPVEFDLPEGLTAETPSATEIIIRGADRQKVGQVAANIRAVRPPEPYKGKGIRYAGEYVAIKETKKK